MGEEPLVTSYTCPTCDRTFATEQGLINHLKNVHADQRNNPTPSPSRN